jgi:TonB family protein
MLPRHAFIAALLLSAVNAAAALSPGDAAAFRTIIDDRFPGRRGTIFVADSTPASITRGTEGVSLRGIDLGSHVTFVSSQRTPRFVLRDEPSGIAAFVFHLPNVDEQRHAVRVAYELAIPEGKRVRSGSGAYLLRPAKGGAWEIDERQESLASINPRKDPGAVLVGGDVKAPKRLEGDDPVPTPEAARARVSGIVLLEITVDDEGRVIGATVLKPLPFGLDRAAVDAVMKWRFSPGTLNTRPVPVIYDMTVSFKAD